MVRMYVSIAAFMCLYASSASQMIIPMRPLGYIYNGGSNDAPIHLDIHMGPLCPDSRDALPMAKMVADNYGKTTLKLTLHMFPLPYHHQAYLTAIGAQTVRKVGGVDAAYKWFDLVYSKLEYMGNDAVANLTTGGVISRLASYGSTIIPIERFLDGMADETLETATRAAWKYSCSRAISGTPTFLLNDVRLDADPNWTLSDWKKVIDPLLFPAEKADDNTCRTGTKRCEYIPGKIECCTDGEACIPDVGCRCWSSSYGCKNAVNDKVANTTCRIGTKRCEYLPDKIECCTNGEACIPNVGCRCWGNGCNKSALNKKAMKNLPKYMNAINRKTFASRKRKASMVMKKIRSNTV